MHLYRYELDQDMIEQTNIKGYHAEIDLHEGKALLTEDGKLHIYAGFKSDGNTLSFTLIFGFYKLNDGPIDPKTGLPITARAFYVHDVLIKLSRKSGQPLPFKKIHQEYKRLLKKTNFKYKRLYYTAVQWFGPRK